MPQKKIPSVYVLTDDEREQMLHLAVVAMRTAQEELGTTDWSFVRADGVPVTDDDVRGAFTAQVVCHALVPGILTAMFRHASTLGSLIRPERAVVEVLQQLLPNLSREQAEAVLPLVRAEVQHYRNPDFWNPDYQRTCWLPCR
jgi:hypothetical protein